MQLKTKDEIQAEINKARGTQGFGAAADDAAEKVMALCTANSGVVNAAVSGDGVSAVPIMALITLALQILPIIFGDGGFTLEKLQQVLTLILSIFQ